MSTTLSLIRFSPIRSSIKTLKKPSLRPSTLQSPRIPNMRIPNKKISMSYSTIPSTDRLISSLPYTLPFINSISYGRFLFSQFPILLQPLVPFFPLISAFHSLPFAGFVAFFALYLGVVRNPSFSRFVRFNAMQAVVLEVLLAIPSLLQRVFGVPVRGVGLKVMEVGYGGIFVFAAGCFVFSVVSCVLGRTPYLPTVATAADRQL